MVLGLTVATPEGTWETGRAPRSAAGPDLRQLVLGSEGAFGVITSVTVRARPLPATRVYEGWRFPSFEAGTRALRALAQDGCPTVLRLSDETETFIGLAHPDRIGGTDGAAPAGCMAVVGYEGTEADTALRRAGAREVLLAAGGEYAGEEPGERWARGRYDAPYLRDALLDAGAFAETLETAAFWSRLPGLYAAVREALTSALTDAGTPPLVMCHISTCTRTAPRCTSPWSRPRVTTRRPLGARQACGERGDHRRGRHHQPPPRSGHRPPRLVRQGGGTARRARPAGGQGRPRPGGDPQPRHPHPLP